MLLLTKMCIKTLQMFSEGGEHTIEPFDEKLAFLIGNRVDLSYYDKSTVNRMYHCQGQ